MEISGITPGMKRVDVEAEIIEISPTKEFSKFGRAGRVASAIIQDSTGKMQLTLWDEQIDMAKPGTKVRVKNAYVKEWQGEMQLTIGRLGSLETL